MSAATSSLQDKWDAMYALRKRIVQFVTVLEQRNRLHPPPFHRHLIGGDAHIEQLQIRHSETISRYAEEYMVGTFNGKSSADSSNDHISHSVNTFLCNYPGWLLTQQEYSELNDEQHENMNALYGVEVALKAFAAKHWKATWDPAWKDIDWVVLGDPVTVGANINTLSGAKDKTYNCELRINYSADMKIATLDGRYAVSSDLVTVHRQAKVSIAHGDELFVAYDNVIRHKLQTLAKRSESNA